MFSPGNGKRRVRVGSGLDPAILARFAGGGLVSLFAEVSNAE
jgi:hypothetical protein